MLDVTRRPPSANGRAALTLIELLVVIAIVAVLMGLTLCAVQQTRAAALRMACANNLRQIGLGLTSYHDARQGFPPGFSDDWYAPYPLLSWMGRILPYIDQNPLWTQTEAAYQADPLQMDLKAHAPMSVPVPTYLCPACPVAPLVRFDDGTVAALGCYRGVAGTDMLAGDGILFRNSAVRLGDVLDGSSNTLLIGESVPVSAGANSLGVWYDGVGLSDGASLYGSPEVVLGVREKNIVGGAAGPNGQCPSGPYDFRRGTANSRCDVFHFWSGHVGGANFLAADGSVHFRAYGSEAVLVRLATRAGGEVAGVEDY